MEILQAFVPVILVITWNIFFWVTDAREPINRPALIDTPKKKLPPPSAYDDGSPSDWVREGEERAIREWEEENPPPKPEAPKLSPVAKVMSDPPAPGYSRGGVLDHFADRITADRITVARIDAKRISSLTGETVRTYYRTDPYWAYAPLTWDDDVDYRATCTCPDCRSWREYYG